MVAKSKSTAARSPSAAIAKAALKARKQKGVLKNAASAVEAAFRKSGGYGTATVSVWQIPKGGIEKSPAYRKLLTRAQVDKNGKPPPPELRDGAPLKGGYPLDKYPPNVLVDGQRVAWLPDSWAQVLKNTGPGGVYTGWMSPEGKFTYHKDNRGTTSGSVEEQVGRKLGVRDGINATYRNLRSVVPAGADKVFLDACLKSTEKKHLRPAKDFHFAVVSARRATNEGGILDILVLEGHFKNCGVQPTWYVDAESLKAYQNLGLNAKVGGKLTPARNMALEDAKKAKKVCVQVSDDISKWTFYDVAKQNLKGETDFKKANNLLLGSKRYSISPLAAAQFILAKMRSSPDSPRLGGVFPTSNAAMTLGTAEYGNDNFILGDFFVTEPSSPCLFDTKMTLKEDYDFTCSHIHEHGSVLRCNRMFLTVKHSTNAGGAVASRDNAGQKEKFNIRILQSKWPNVFKVNTRRKGVAGTEVQMRWSRFGKDQERQVKVKKLHLKKKVL